MKNPKSYVAPKSAEEHQANDVEVQQGKYKGQFQVRKHRFWRVDGRAVTYQDGKPYMEENGESVSIVDYLEICKKVRRQQAEEQ
ncbi:MAG: hypothetical protein P8130_15615 [Deltaproteobacteria bacterium]